MKMYKVYLYDISFNNGGLVIDPVDYVIVEDQGEKGVREVITNELVNVVSYDKDKYSYFLDKKARRQMKKDMNMTQKAYAVLENELIPDNLLHAGPILTDPLSNKKYALANEDLSKYFNSLDERVYFENRAKRLENNEKYKAMSKKI